VAKDSPPIALIHGADDKVVSVDQSRLFAKKLAELGRPFSFLVVEGSGHDFEEIDKTNGRMAIAAVLAFLEEHLLKNSEAKALVKKADQPLP
jgi:dipeptidyl aminopeptidase/acylaminoacyl peptidase